MINLTGTDAIYAGADSASKVNYVISGSVTDNAATHFTLNSGVLASGQLGSSVTSLYTPNTGAAARVGAIVFFNTDTSTRIVTVAINGSATTNTIVNLTLQAGYYGTYEGGAGWQVFTATGVPVQSSVTLGSVEALFTADQQILSGTGNGTGELIDLMTALLEYATAVSTTNTVTLSNKRITRRYVTVTQSATPTINTDNTDTASITGLAQAITSMTTNLSGTPNGGDQLIVEITDNGTARAITWGAKFEASTVALPTTTVISTKLTVGFIWNVATSAWRCVAVA